MNKKIKASLFCFIALLSGFCLHAQDRSVYGIVKDHEHYALSGANVMVKGTSVGTQTNLLGAFALTGPGSPFTLIISYTGCKTQEVAIQSNQNEYLITLDCRDVEEKFSKLSEIINIKLLKEENEK